MSPALVTQAGVAVLTAKPLGIPAAKVSSSAVALMLTAASQQGPCGPKGDTGQAGPVGATGAVGPQGPTSENTGVAIVASTFLSAGTPVAISRTTGQLIPARSDMKWSAFVVGIITSDVLAGFAALPSRGPVTLADWTAATGASALAMGQIYFLGSSGGMSTSYDSVAGQCVTRIGIASSPSTLVVQPVDPIQL